MRNGSTAAPVVTVVIPAWSGYGGAPLREAVASLWAQEVPIEVVVVNNASTVPLAEVPGCRVVTLDERRSLGAARNAGLEHVKTPYVVFWDADDVMLPGTLARLLRALEDNPDAVAACPAIVDGDTGRLRHWPRKSTRALAPHPSLFAWVNCVWSLFPATGSRLRSVAVRDAGGFADTDSGDDRALAASLGFRGRVVIDPHRGRWYGRTAGSVSSGWRAFPHVWHNAGMARRRMAEDPAVPGWARASRPLVAVAQLAILCLVRPLARGLRDRRPVLARPDDLTIAPPEPVAAGTPRRPSATRR
jgi:glycosyltransferase involved in cell wall biosynthesis